MTVRLGWKILSVLLATLVWVLIRVNSGDGLRFGQVRTFDAVPIHVMTPANDPGVFAVEPPSVRLAVSALPATLKRLRLTDLLVFVNLSSVPEAEAYRDVEVHVPPGVTLAALLPNQVRVLRLASPPVANPSPEP